MKKIFFAAVFIIIPLIIFSQEDFGFGFDDDTATNSGANTSIVPAVKISGEIGADFTFYPGEKNIDNHILGDIFFGSVNLKAENSFALAFIGISLDNLSEGITTYRDVLDEVYVRAFLGKFTLEGGLRKLTWGKADSYGPNDVINPHDYRNLKYLPKPQKIKIPVPLLHLSYNIGNFTKIETVFVPTFTPDRYAQLGRWAPLQFTQLPDLIKTSAGKYIATNCPPPYQTMLPTVLGQLNAQQLAVSFPEGNSVEYAQAGARFSTSVNGSVDLGFEYYYGRWTQPSVSLTGIDNFWNHLQLNEIKPDIHYDKFHLIGIDWAQVLWRFNVRAEAAAFLTEDLEGTDGAIRNPQLAWSLGFDLDLFAGINLNLQCNETIILLHDKITKNRAIDCQADSKITASRISVKLAKTFFKDELELSSAVVWNIEDGDCAVFPALVWARGDLSAELSSGIFFGNTNGELGQYSGNSFLRTAIMFKF